MLKWETKAQILSRHMTAVFNRCQDGRSNIKEFITIWNAVFPIDKWWREKHQIPFGSKLHGESSLCNMYAEYVEDTEMFVTRKDEYVAGSRDIFRSRADESDDDYDDLYDNIDLDKF